MKIQFYLFLLLFLLPGLQTVKGENLYFRHYNNKQGLSHNTVYCSLQDKRGFMWFGTDDGLNRFDGHTFKVYRHNSYQPESLPNDHIISLFEDSEEKIWVCTNRGTCYYDYHTDAFHPLQLANEENTPEYFISVREDKQGNLWFLDYNRIVRYSPSDRTTRSYPGSTHVYSTLAISDEGLPIVADYYDFYQYNPQADNFFKIPALGEADIKSQNHISTICPVPDVGILIGTEKGGLMLYNNYDKNTTTLIPAIQVRSIIPFNKNTYWIASESGIHIYNILTRSIRQLTKSLTNEYTIADNAVYSLTKDKEGGIWVGSFFGGISYLPKEYTGFNHFIGGKTHPQMLGNAVREICPDQYGNLWLGTEDNGINQYNLKTGKITNYSYNNTQHPLSATNIHGLFADKNKLWVGTFNKGIDLLDIPSGKIIKRYNQANTGNNLGSDFVLCFEKTQQNEFLIGTSNGIFLYNEEKDDFNRWKDIYALIRQIYEDTDGNIWVASTNGIYCYHQTDGTMTHFTSDMNRSQSIGSNNTTSIFEDSHGRIWVTTVNGFSLYNEKTGLFNHISVENGLPSNIIYRIVEDNNGFFWISTANGLVHFNPETYAMRTFTYKDGLHEAQFNYSSSYKAPDGTIYMGTINGMISFNPQSFKEDTFSPPIYITRIHLPGEEKKKYNIETPFTGDTKKLELPYNASTFTLSYVALSYTSPEAIRYAYMLDGVDKDWIYMNQNQEVTFANLSPGKYTFRVKSTNSSGIWQNNEQALSIIITPPFWATNWAFMAYALSVCFLIFLFYKYKKTKLEEKLRINRQIFENKKEKELSDAKIQFFTFITHEIRTPLTLINAPLEKIIKSGDGNTETKRNLHIIEKNTQRLLNLSNQLLDFRKTESRGFRLNYVKTDVTLWLNTILQPYLPLMEKEHKIFKTDIPEKHLYADIDREAFSKIMDNLLTNAIKYSDKFIHLHVNSEQTDNFSITIINDGFLIPENEREKIFSPFYRLKETENKQGSGIGLSLALSLAEFHKGTILYNQAEGGMNLFTLTLPYNQKEGYQILTMDDEQESITPVPSVQDTGKPVILIVEDQSDMRQFIARELSDNYAVLEAENGKIAIQILKNNVIHLIISDVMMPVMDGFEFCNQVKNDINFSHIPFILLTAQHNLQSRLKGLNTGADAYMEKPFSTELLLAQVENLLKNRELLNKAYFEKPLIPVSSLSASPVDDIFLKKLNAFMDEQISNESLSVEMVAQEMGMSTSSLYRKVKGLSGLSPVDFIKVSRLKKAVQLMQNGEERINTIAFQVGFSSPAYFSTCFLKQYGKTPTEFMRDIQPGNSKYITD
ncbi:two-component regulator propeller domain-containing protein [Parabacteroides sp. AM08-6]|uniref:hybrid sensor histidine kinase/response regulator transcription factor n=1 Tax=Parabacteroides sp. AM08-6 TaxID=2292053 RepID=UPI000F001F69|nr:two-component regulator propeller domain-containing protein [Parabacteroides sp. AM08-6]RHJ81535.1 hybrid sensor histidine kinase/response regulator [Parabacteroides sp. AM08-6]